jgi:hypothetical protein
MQFFSNVPAMSFGADIWEWRETHIKKKEKKKKAQPIVQTLPWKARL